MNVYILFLKRGSNPNDLPHDYVRWLPLAERLAGLKNPTTSKNRIPYTLNRPPSMGLVQTIPLVLHAVFYSLQLSHRRHEHSVDYHL